MGVLWIGKAHWLLTASNTCGQDPHPLGRAECSVVCVRVCSLNMLSERNATGSDSFIAHQIVVSDAV